MLLSSLSLFLSLQPSVFFSLLSECQHSCSSFFFGSYCLALLAFSLISAAVLRITLAESSIIFTLLRKKENTIEQTCAHRQDQTHNHGVYEQCVNEWERMGGISLGKLKAKSEACQITKRNIWRQRRTKHVAFARKLITFLKSVLFKTKEGKCRNMNASLILYKVISVFLRNTPHENEHIFYLFDY